MPQSRARVQKVAFTFHVKTADQAPNPSSPKVLIRYQPPKRPPQTHSIRRASFRRISSWHGSFGFRSIRIHDNTAVSTLSRNANWPCRITLISKTQLLCVFDELFATRLSTAFTA